MIPRYPTALVTAELPDPSPRAASTGSREAIPGAGVDQLRHLEKNFFLSLLRAIESGRGDGAEG
jgi:hypothetical protein